MLALLLFSALLLYAPREAATLEFDRSAYATQSISLAEGHGNTIRLGDEWLPGFYPPAYPASIVAVHWLLGTDSKNGVFASLAFAVVTLLLVYLLARRVRGRAAPPVAVMLLAGNELYGEMASSILSQAFALCLVALVAALAISGDARGRAVRHGFIVGLIAGLSLLVRYQNFILPLSVGLFALAQTSRLGGWSQWLRRLMPVSAGGLIGGLVVMAYCAAEYGSPFRTGYHEWDFPFERTFALRHVFFPEIIQETPPREFFLVRCLLGLGPIYPLPVALLWIAGIVFAWRRGGDGLSRLSKLTLTLNLTLFAILGLYVFRSAVYAMLGVPLVVVMAGVGATFWCSARRIGALPAWVLPVGLAALSTLPAVGRSHVFGDGDGAPAQPGQVAIEAADQLLEDDAVLVGFCDLILADHLFVGGTQRRYLYVKRKDLLPRVIASVRRELGGADFSPAAVGDYVERKLSEGRRVYFMLPLPGSDVNLDAAVRLRQALAARFQLGKSEMPELETLTR